MEDKNKRSSRPQRQVIEPVTQLEIAFHGHVIIALELEDGRIAVVLRWVCEALQINPQAQVQRIERTESLVDDLVYAKVRPRQTGSRGGGTQPMYALALRGFSPWVLGINASEVKADDPAEEQHIQELIIAYQEEAKDVLYEHFLNRRRLTLPEPEDSNAVVPAEPQQPTIPASQADRDTWIQYYEQMIAWHQQMKELELWRAQTDGRIGQLESWQGSVESRMESIEEIVRSVLPQATLTSEHQSAVRVMVEELWQLTGEHRQAIYFKLNQTFHAPKYSDILEESWSQVERWLQRRINAARTGKTHSGDGKAR
jgi:hypothetical protein